MIIICIMTQDKNQHYVPRCYLKNFCFKGSSIYRFDKTNNGCSVRNIDKVCNEFYFYDEEDNKDFEKILSKIESELCPAIDDFIKNDFSKVKPNSKQSIAEFICVQELRTKEFRTTLSLATDALNKALEKKAGIKNCFSVSEDKIKKLQRSCFEDIPTYVSILKDMKWVIFNNNSRIPFVTSDNPVVRFNPITSRFFGNLGLKSPGVQVYFPLSHNKILGIIDPNIECPTEMSLNSDDEVNGLNLLQVRNSLRYLCSCSGNFSFAIYELKRNPIFCDPKRKRFDIV